MEHASGGLTFAVPASRAVGTKDQSYGIRMPRPNRYCGNPARDQGVGSGDGVGVGVGDGDGLGLGAGGVGGGVVGAGVVGVTGLVVPVRGLVRTLSAASATARSWSARRAVTAAA